MPSGQKIKKMHYSIVIKALQSFHPFGVFWNCFFYIHFSYNNITFYNPFTPSGFFGIVFFYNQIIYNHITPSGFFIFNPERVP